MYHYYNSSTADHFQHEKEIYSKIYKGELCSIMDTSNGELVMIILAYLIAALLKGFNTYNYFLQEARVASKLKDEKIQEVFKR